MEMIVKIVADGLVVPVVLLGAYALLVRVPHNQKYKVYTQALMAGLTVYAVAKIVSMLYQPAALRPFEILGVEPGATYLNNPGFPSDHALFTMAITLAVWFATRDRVMAGICFGLTLLVGIGRVLALVHTPLDVVGGLVIACVGIIWYQPFSSSKRKRLTN